MAGYFWPPPPLAPTPLYGKTTYRYFTPDGGPPNQGKPPSAGSNAPPPYSVGNPPPPPPPPPPAQGSPFFFSGEPLNPPPMCFTAGVPVAGIYCSTATAQKWSIPVPPPPPPPPPAPPAWWTQTQQGLSGPPEAAPPMTGNRVKDQLATFPDKKMGFIFPKRIAIVHVFHENITNKYPPGADEIITIPSNEMHNLFSVQAASCDMSIAEFIEQIDCKSRANAHGPYPDYGIGIQELLEIGGGRFRYGSKIMLSDPRAAARIGELWPESTGEAGQGRPPYVIRCPV